MCDLAFCQRAAFMGIRIPKVRPDPLDCSGSQTKQHGRLLPAEQRGVHIILKFEDLICEALNFRHGNRTLMFFFISWD